MANAPTTPNTPTTLTVDGVEYPVASLSNNAKAMVNTIRMADREMRRLEASLSLARIARQALGNSLKAELASIKKADAPAVTH
ncbi:MAG: hypothetical protein RLZ81_291 [Pseudomonadota bacterium]|jgi:hypothetical protein